ncbi:carbohydrate sulfotransferase 3-like isoform X1 [Penaeus chinensis]|uniref:carbohydrate sulfotransferase 3-like isoform X1 n=1 Tax=Penaeus chinensis TaxID=139456 RepID=UPI001FB634C0|nr:carbohydrate sulfotransferase 3-like isoform X1 [Penaeus chinensis]
MNHININAHILSYQCTHNSSFFSSSTNQLPEPTIIKIHTKLPVKALHDSSWFRSTKTKISGNPGPPRSALFSLAYQESQYSLSGCSDWPWSWEPALSWKRAPSSRDKSPGNGTQDQTDTDRRVATARPAAAPEPPKVRHPPNILLLSSMGRSGSSFLGGLLNSQPGSFYIFEPLHSLEARRMLSDAVARETFTQIASCNFTGSLLSGLASEPDFAIRTPSAYSCKHTKKANQTCFDAKKLKQACDKLPIKIIKTIRTRVAWLEPLLRDPRANLLAIHLVRDPRASIISAIERDWNVRPERKCSELEDDLLSGLQLEKLLPGRYMTVRYEDLCEDPYKMARIIFSFLGYKTLPLSTLSFLEKSTAKSDGQTYGIRRDTSKQQQKWRQEITTEQLQGIEEACASAIAAVGFNLFADIGRARNLSVPLYDPAKASVFFPYYGGR